MNPRLEEEAPGEPPGLMERVLQTNERRDTRTEYDRYLSAPPCCPKGEPAAWFKSYGLTFFCCFFRNRFSPFLSRFKKIFSLFRKFCASPGAATKIESLWSESGYLISPRRTRLAPTFVDQRLQWKMNSRVLESVTKKGK